MLRRKELTCCTCTQISLIRFYALLSLFAILTAQYYYSTLSHSLPLIIMQFLSYNDLNDLVATAPLPPTLPPTSASVGPYECPICLEFKHGLVVLHSSCMRPLCAQDAIELLNCGANCGLCRAPMRDHATSRVLVIKPTPNDQYWLDRIEYECPNCQEKMPGKAAKDHRGKCVCEPQPHQPPKYISPWTRQNIVRREVISNPPFQTGIGTARDRLFITHFNGRQFSSFQMPKNKTIYQLKVKLHDRLGNVDICSIRIFRFSHVELTDDQNIRDVANVSGATHIAAFTDLPKKFAPLTSCWKKSAID